MDFDPNVTFEEAYEHTRLVAENCGYVVEKLDNYRLRIHPADEHAFYDLTWLDGKLFKVEKRRQVHRIFVQAEIQELS